MGQKSGHKKARRVRQGEQGPNPSYVGDEFAFVDHVPEGMRPCNWCCRRQSGLAVMPGFFRDFDVDGGAGRFGVCVNCGGTGVELGLKHEEQDELSRCRFMRDQRAHARERLYRELAISAMVGEEREALHVLADQVVAMLDKGRLTAEQVKVFQFGIRSLDGLFPHADEAETFAAACQRAGASGDRTALRAEFVHARDAIRALLPKDDLGDRERMRTAGLPVRMQLEAEEKRHAAWFNDPLPYEEWKLLLLVHWYWDRAGRPKGTYAEQLISDFSEALSRRPPEYRCRVGPAAIARFTPKDVPPELSGVTAELLADLHDCIAKFGIEDFVEHVRRGSLREPVEVYVTVSTDSEKRGIVIIGPGRRTSAGTHLFSLAEGTHLILWDTRVSIANVRTFIAHVDALMTERGLIDAETGARTKLVSDAVQEKMAVDTTFATPGTVIPILPGMRDAEAMRQEFDRPDEVAIVQDIAGTVLCRASDLPHIQHRHRVAERVLKRHGLALTPDAFDQVPWKRVIEIREEIDREMAKEQN